MRMLFVDSTGGLVKVTKQMHEDYQRVCVSILFVHLFLLLYHFFVLAYVSKLNEPGAVISETISSEHDTGRLSEMFRLIKKGYKKVFDTTLFFRFVVCDLCWPTIHSMLETMNLEDIEEYSKRIYKYAEINEKDVDPAKQKGF